MVSDWMGVPKPLKNMLRKLMSSWKTRLKLNIGNHKVQSRWIRIRWGFLQGDSYSPVGFCLTEVPVTILLEETIGYRMGPPVKDSRRGRTAYLLMT